MLQKRSIFYLLKEPPLIFKEALLKFFKGFKEFPFRSYFKFRSPDYEIINFVNTQKSDVETASKNSRKIVVLFSKFLRIISLTFSWIGHLIREQGTDKLRNIVYVLKKKSIFNLSLILSWDLKQSQAFKNIVFGKT